MCCLDRLYLVLFNELLPLGWAGMSTRDSRTMKTRMAGHRRDSVLTIGELSPKDYTVLSEQVRNKSYPC